MKLALTLLALIALPAFGVVDAMDLDADLAGSRALLDSLGFGTVHSSMGLLGAGCFAIAVAIRLRSGRAR